MKTITTANANRGFSNLLREVSKGGEVIILSRGTPVAKVISVKSTVLQKNAMKKLLLSRLKAQVVTGSRNWTETVNAGWNSIVGSDFDKIIHAVQNVEQGSPIMEYGTDNAANNIVKILLNKGNLNTCQKSCK